MKPTCTALSALASGDAGPPTVRPAEHKKRWSIPAAPTIDDIESPVVAVRLDPEIVAARLAETATVTALLADIFTDDEPETDSASHPAAEASVVDDADVVPIEGLDGAHSALAHRLRSQSSWDRSEAGEIAASLGLPLLDGALDRINEAALDLCGDPLVEGDDPLEINHYAVEELFQ